MQKVEIVIEDEQSLSEKNVALQEILFRMGDIMFQQRRTLMAIVDPSIFDKVINGKEYQLIKRQHLLDLLKIEGIDISSEDRVILKELLWPIWKDAVDIKRLETIMRKVGISEDYPLSNKHFNYKAMNGPAIRTFNKVIKYMADNDIENVFDMIPKDKIENIIV